MSSFEEYNDPAVKLYFHSIPILKKEDIKATIDVFAKAKEEAITALSKSEDSIKYIIKICEDVLNDERKIEDTICDSDEVEPGEVGEEPKTRSITMHSTKKKFKDRTFYLKMSKHAHKRYEIIYRMKFKISVITEILKGAGLGTIAQALIDARNKVVEANLRLVIKKVNPWVNKGVPIMDLIQEGNVGLMVAIDKYDHRRSGKSKFTTMAMHWIKLFVTRVVMNKSKTVRIPVHINNAMNKVNKAVRKFFAENGRQPEVKELAEAMGLPIAKISSVITQIQNNPYIINDNNHFDEDDTGSFIDNLPDDQNVEDSAIRNLDYNTIKAKMVECFKDLTPRQEKVIRLRYAIGMDNDTDLMEFHEIGEACDGISKKRAHDLHEVSIKKFKKQLVLKELWEES